MHINQHAFLTALAVHTAHAVMTQLNLVLALAMSKITPRALTSVCDCDSVCCHDFTFKSLGHLPHGNATKIDKICFGLTC